jgi:hypothetical protein
VRRPDWTWKTRWKTGPFAHTCASVVGISMEPSVVGRGWSPVSSNKARGYRCRTLCRPSSRIYAPYVAHRRSRGAGLVPGPQVLCFLCPLPLRFYREQVRKVKWHVEMGLDEIDKLTVPQLEGIAFVRPFPSVLHRPKSARNRP